MILSRFVLSQTSLEAARDAASAYEMHRTLRRLVGNHSCLWRREGHVVLLQSDGPANWSLLPPGYLAALPAQRSFDETHLRLDSPLRFRLRANPSARSKSPDGKGRRQAIKTRDAQLEWLARQGDRRSFSVQTAEVGEPTAIILLQERSGRSITIHTCLFEGVLRVTDKQPFLAALTGGIGPGKAFGLGLLSISAT